MNFRKYLPNILLIILFVATFIVNMQIGLFGDDYYYATFIKNDFWQLHQTHYLQVNGRAIVHLLDTIFLALPNIFWAIANSFMLTAIAYFAKKIVMLFSSKEESSLITVLVFFFGILMLHIDVVRQSVYWVTGSFNYVYPAFMLFWYMYELFKNFKNDFNGNLFPLVILAFFATATVEQAGMMSFGTTVLLLIYSFIKNKKSDVKGSYKKIIIVLLASALGLASVILAPSQFIRIGLEENEEISMIENIKSCFIFLAKTYVIKYLPQVLLAIFSLILLIINKKTAKLNSDEIFLIVTAVILGIGSQAMMLVSPVYGERNTLFGIFMIMLFTAILLQKISFDKNKIFQNLSYIFFACITILSLANIYITYSNYKTSNSIQKQNIAIINEYKASNNANTKICLYKLKNDAYGWSMPYVSKYHENWFKVYYEIEDAEITWLD